MTGSRHPCFDPAHPLPPPWESQWFDASRWDRDLLLGEAQEAAPGSPEAAGTWLRLGLLCAERVADGGDPEQGPYDRALARAALERGLAADGGPVELRAHGYLHLAQLLLTEDDGHPTPATVDRAETLVAAVVNLPRDTVDADAARWARLHLPEIAALRWSLTGAPSDHARAVAGYTALLDGKSPEAGEGHEPALAPADRAALQEALARLLSERAAHIGDAPGLAEGARHFAEARAARVRGAQADADDVSPIGDGRGVALFNQGVLASDAGLFREADAAFTASGEEARARQAASAAQSASEGEAFWADRAQRAETLAVCAAVQAWQVDGAAAAPGALVDRVRSVTGSAAHTGAAVPNVLVALACFLVDLPAADTDPTEQAHALELLEEAAARWLPEHGPPHVPFLKLAAYRLDLSSDRPAELLASARAAAAVLDRTAEPNPLLSALLIRAVVRAQLLAGGGNTADPDAARYRAETAAAAGAGTPTDAEHWTRTVDQLVGPTEDVEELLRRWQQGTDRDTDHVAHAMVLLRHTPLLDPDRTRLTPDRLQALLETVAPVEGALGRNASMAVSVAQGHYGALRAGPLLGRAVEAAGVAATATGAPGEHGPATGHPDVMVGMESVLRILNGVVNGGHDDVTAGVRAMRDLIRRMEGMTEAERAGLPDLAGLQAVFPVLSTLLEPGSAGPRDRALAALSPEVLGMDPGHPAWEALRTELARTATPPASGDIAALDLVRSTAGMPSTQRAGMLAAIGTARAARAYGSRDRSALRDAAAVLRAARDAAVRGDDVWLGSGMLIGLLGCGEAVLGRPWSRRRRLDEAIEVLDQTYRETGGPEHPFRAHSGFLFAKSLRLRDDGAAGDRQRSRRIAADALRATAYGVLLQAGTADAATAAAGASATALSVAHWCLADGEPAEAAWTLDACRGLVLHAATTARTVERRLSDAGHGALADRWARVLASGAAPASALRREVLDVLLALDGDAAARLLSPPGVPRIAAALRTLGRDALVYLLPAGPPGSVGEGAGAALVVAADGRTGVVPLPLLREDAEPIRQYLVRPEGGPVRQARMTATPPERTGPRRDAGVAPADGFDPAAVFDPVAAFDALTTVTTTERGGRPARRDMGSGPGTHVPPRARSLSQRLDRLCAWAWQAVAEPLACGLDRDVPVAPAGRAPRLVLVPMGELSAVPWHAAWSTRSGGGRRYALDTAEFTYTASARLLCEVAERPARPRTDAALIVGDPTGDLPFAGREAAAVREAYYPQAVYLGRAGAGGLTTPGGTGRPQEVLAWLRSGAGRGGTLHLACHATVVENVRHSAALLLHGGNLAAEELTETIDGDADGGHPDLVVLAACRSHVSGRGTNEAYTLATAFLTAGARSVVGSLWPVPDEATSLLMFMTHHYLRAEGRGPAEALRLAQRWMADPGRSLPPHAPDGLARLLPRIVPDDLSAWAGFIATGR
ncbi:CHAT domain-containing protein [Streptomyces sp. NPDC058874]|uniref:CHAT domain-containing protein n=1 Tax=unclassified Streptomyces TaxID=2593676 RepID=UPI0036B21842